MSEREILSEGGIVVTSERLVMRGGSFAISSMTGVRVGSRGASKTMSLSILALGSIGLAGVVWARPTDAPLWLVFALVVLLGLVLLVTQPKAELYVRMRSRELLLASGSRARMLRIESALRMALAEANERRLSPVVRVWPVGGPGLEVAVSAAGLACAKARAEANVLVVEPASDRGDADLPVILWLEAPKSEELVASSAIEAVGLTADAYAGDPDSLAEAARWLCSTEAPATADALALAYLGTLGELRPLGAPAIGARFLLDAPVRVGRSDDCEIRLRQGAHSDQNTVARVHARFERSGDAVIVTELGSTNGTWLRGVRIDGAARMEVGDDVAIAWSHRFRLVRTGD